MLLDRGATHNPRFHNFPSRIAGCEPTPRADPAVTYFAEMLDVERGFGVRVASLLAAGAYARGMLERFTAATRRGRSATADRRVAVAQHGIVGNVVNPAQAQGH